MPNMVLFLALGPGKGSNSPSTFATFCGETPQNRALDDSRLWGLAAQHHCPIKGFPPEPSMILG